VLTGHQHPGIAIRQCGHLGHALQHKDLHQLPCLRQPCTAPQLLQRGQRQRRLRQQDRQLAVGGGHVRREGPLKHPSCMWGGREGGGAGGGGHQVGEGRRWRSAQHSCNSAHREHNMGAGQSPDTVGGRPQDLAWTVPALLLLLQQTHTLRGGGCQHQLPIVDWSQYLPLVEAASVLACYPPLLLSAKAPGAKAEKLGRP
jgi:hypothetical protein